METNQPNQYYISFYYRRVFKEYDTVLQKFGGIHHKKRGFWDSPDVRIRKDDYDCNRNRVHFHDMGQDGKFSVKSSDTINTSRLNLS